MLSSTKGTEESSALDSIIIDLIKTCSFCTQINFFVIRWWCMGSQFDLLDAEAVILLAKYTNSMTVSEYICILLTHYSMVTPYQLNYIPSVLDLFYYNLLVLAPFHQSLVLERQLIFNLSGINPIDSWVQLAFWSEVSMIYIYICIYIFIIIWLQATIIFNNRDLFSQSLLTSWVLILGCKSIFQPNLMMQYLKVQWVFCL